MASELRCKGVNFEVYLNHIKLSSETKLQEPYSTN